MEKNGSEVSAKRGRPSRTEAEVEDIKSNIARHAMRLFQEDGYEAVSMRRLAKEAGCTVMTLYRYYERKIDILRALWAEIFNDLFDKLDAVAAAEPDPTRRLYQVAHGYLAYWLERREHYFMVFMSSDVSQSDVSVFIGEDASLARFSVFYETLGAALGLDLEQSEVNFKTQQLLCFLNGTAHNMITISAFPWVDPKDLVAACVSDLLKT